MITSGKRDLFTVVAEFCNKYSWLRTQRDKAHLTDSYIAEFTALNDPDSVRTWIPTKERNPEKPGEYWTQLDKHNQGLATWGGFAWIEYTEMGGFDCSPLAWMPLPASYKEDV